MSLSSFSLGDSAISQLGPVEEGRSKSPPRRQTTAKADAAVAPEPR